jgi:cyclic-di-AMP phosphodiesterase PgpH
MRSKQLLLAIILTLCTASLYYLLKIDRESLPDLALKEGQTATENLIAPFDFPVLKTKAQIESEYERTLSELPKPYRLDDEAEFTALAKTDRLFGILAEFMESGDVLSLQKKMQSEGFRSGATLFAQIRNSSVLEGGYRKVRSNIERIYRIGLVAETDTDSVLIAGDQVRQKKSIMQLYRVNQAKPILIEGLPSPLAELLALNVDELIKPNVVIDLRQFEEDKKDALAMLSQETGMINKGEIILKQDNRITAKDVNVLNSLAKEYKLRSENRNTFSILIRLLGFLFYVLVVFIILNSWPQSRQQDKFSNPSHDSAFILNGGVFINVMLFCITPLFGNEAQFIPISITIISTAVLLGFDVALLQLTASMLLLGPFVSWDTKAMEMLSLSCLFTLLLIHHFGSIHGFLRFWLFQFLAFCMVILVFRSFEVSTAPIGDRIAEILKDFGYSFITATISILGCFLITNFYERRWNKATKQVLLELLDFEHPLLKRLATTAVGTYHHSLIVGNLAEQAAEAIGANSLLARVGSYYHDIGKVVNPDIFTENNDEAQEYHNQFIPQESAELIKNHVRDGVALAKKYELPQDICDIIIQHHGTTFIRYFYDIAQRSGEILDQVVFKYPGPLPQSREAILVMLADVLESITKSKQDLTDDIIWTIVEETNRRLLNEGQFSEAPITMKELNIACEVMATILVGVYRRRLEYPEEQEVIS